MFNKLYGCFSQSKLIVHDFRLHGKLLSKKIYMTPIHIIDATDVIKISIRVKLAIDGMNTFVI